MKWTTTKVVNKMLQNGASKVASTSEYDAIFCTCFAIYLARDHNYSRAF